MSFLWHVSLGLEHCPGYTDACHPIRTSIHDECIRHVKFCLTDTCHIIVSGQFMWVPPADFDGR